MPWVPLLTIPSWREFSIIYNDTHILGCYHMSLSCSPPALYSSVQCGKSIFGVILDQATKSTFSSRIGIYSNYGADVRFAAKDARFLTSVGGSSWHRADVAFIFWVPFPSLSPSLWYMLIFAGWKTLAVTNSANNSHSPLTIRRNLPSQQAHFMRIF